MGTRQQGTVKWYCETKGYGFIVPDAGADIFVHFSGIYENQSLRKGDRVSFVIRDDARGRRAIEVTVVAEGKNLGAQAAAVFASATRGGRGWAKCFCASGREEL